MVMPVMPMSAWPSEIAGIIASQLMLVISSLKFSRLAISAHRVVLPADRLAGLGIDELQRRIGVLGRHRHLAAAEIGKLGGGRARRAGRGRRREAIASGVASAVAAGGCGARDAGGGSRGHAASGRSRPARPSQCGSDRPGKPRPVSVRRLPAVLAKGQYAWPARPGQPRCGVPLAPLWPYLGGHEDQAAGVLGAPSDRLRGGAGADGAGGGDARQLAADVRLARCWR